MENLTVVCSSARSMNIVQAPGNWQRDHSDRRRLATQSQAHSEAVDVAFCIAPGGSSLLSPGGCASRYI